VPRSSQSRRTPRSTTSDGAGALGDLERLAQLADSLAATWAARARSTTSAGQERAVLRLFGVHGLDSEGRPLAGAVVERWRAKDTTARTGGIALPFAMALLEYDLAPQQLALDVVSGAVDLTLEAELLREPDRRAVAEAEVARLASAATERVDANRIARREIISLLGDAAQPWVGTTLTEPDADAALDEVAALVGAGMDLLRVEIPVGRELTERMHDAGFEVPGWHPRGHGRRGASALSEPAPTGSQRGLAVLRRALDEAAAERRAYARLVTAAPALSAPEGAVVAAFERIDITEGNPLDEIVAQGVDPERSLSDHAFAHRLIRRAGTLLSIGAGPLVVAPDLASGIPSDAATRSGRTVALQALAVAFARHNGLAGPVVAVGALPAWVTEETAPATRAFAEVVVRRALFPLHPLAFDEPDLRRERRAVWSTVVGAALAFAGPTAFVLQRPGPDPASTSRRARAGSSVAAELVAATGPVSLRGAGLDHARAMVAAAVATLEQIGEQGWRAVTGTSPIADQPFRLGRGTVIERGEPFDPLEMALGA
jgi:hypothetical protein